MLQVTIARAARDTITPMQVAIAASSIGQYTRGFSSLMPAIMRDITRKHHRVMIAMAVPHFHYTFTRGDALCLLPLYIMISIDDYFDAAILVLMTAIQIDYSMRAHCFA